MKTKTFTFALVLILILACLTSKAERPKQKEITPTATKIRFQTFMKKYEDRVEIITYDPYISRLLETIPGFKIPAPSTKGYQYSYSYNELNDVLYRLGVSPEPQQPTTN